ncbi:DUF1561 family protein [Bartonella sp. A05]|uniref:DUF1561 family protein n=1 Tax=Bartonella sp. A05 TaxID=2967261 RepID=UPI0022A9CD90|nr:DUF1561 family protein [Bartonella sp. A05]MCZ2204273.1 DUF1561 domain-containing protein [Bartonella sp. A05]
MKNYSLRLFLFFFIFFLQISSAVAVYDYDFSFSYKDRYNDDRYEDNSGLYNEWNTSPPYKRLVNIRTHDNRVFCYTPKIENGDGYVVLGICSEDKSRKAVYDVFQRIAWEVNGFWLCMTAPSSVTGIGRRSTESWDYLRLSPCVINDANQRWIIEDRAVYTADRRFRVKDYYWKTYISKNSGDYHDHTIDKSDEMDRWIKTIAQPVNLSSKIFIGWKEVTRNSFKMYYISNNGPKPDVYDFYYNPENGHIAVYYYSTGKMYCITSRQTDSEDRNWVALISCADSDRGKDANYWNVGYLAGGVGSILDYKGRPLRVARQGSKWGVPYTIKTSSLKDDTKDSPTSEFSVSYDLQRWNHYVYGNLLDALSYCPAVDSKPVVNSELAAATEISKPIPTPSSKYLRRVKRELPSEFQLTDEWRARLYEIVTSTRDGDTIAAGACGVCLLQTYEMIMELQQSYPNNPSFSGRRGFFFDIQPGIDPMISFRERYPAVYNYLQDAPRVYGRDYVLPSNDSNIVSQDFTMRILESITEIMLPRYIWRRSPILTNRSAMINHFREMLAASAGTMWIVVLDYRLPNGETQGHAQPIVRGNNGLYLLPTNAELTRAQFNAYTAEINNPEVAYRRLSGEDSINFMTTLQLVGLESKPLNFVMSQSNCTGEGEGRRGTKHFPTSTTVSQCSDGGRCAIQ